MKLAADDSQVGNQSPTRPTFGGLAATWYRRRFPESSVAGAVSRPRLLSNVGAAAGSDADDKRSYPKVGYRACNTPYRHGVPSVISAIAQVASFEIDHHPGTSASSSAARRSNSGSASLILMKPRA